MNKIKTTDSKKNASDQVMYKGTWTDKKYFRAFLFNEKGETQLANSYDEYEKMIASGVWFTDEKIPASKDMRKQKDVIRAAS